MGNRIYFASDFHLGIPDRPTSLERERKLVSWLEMIRSDADELILMGDIFDFWFEYHTAIPMGYARLLGKLAELSDQGIPVHLFRGNHDMWAFHYLQDELNIHLHHDPEFREFNGKKFYLAHGDGLGPGDHGYKFIKKVFANRLNQSLFRLIHPDLGIPLALFWSHRSRYAAMIKEKKEEERTIRLIEERLTIYSQKLLVSHPDLDYLIYGHYHTPYDKKLNDRAIQIVLGDWLTHFSYAVFDGHRLKLLVYHPAP
jgi:UDP-2,3-diacylglucosamine hydrolase